MEGSIIAFIEQLESLKMGISSVRLKMLRLRRLEVWYDLTTDVEMLTHPS
jgi:hypothetical protein